MRTAAKTISSNCIDRNLQVQIPAGNLVTNANAHRKIGDEFGLILPQELLRACGFGSEATVTVLDRYLLVAPKPHPCREGWAEAIDAIPPELLKFDADALQAFRDSPDDWDEQGWQWPDSGDLRGRKEPAASKNGISA